MEDPKAELKAQLEEVERRSGSRFTVGLSALAGGLAVALLVACIGGGLYIGQLQKTVAEQKDMIEDADTQTSTGNTYHIKYESSNSKEDDTITVDTKRDTEMFIKKNEDGDITAISVANFKRGIFAMYLPQIEECYIASGVDAWMSNTSASVAEYEKDDGKTVHVESDDDSTVKFTKASDTPVKDHSILPYDIRSFCLGKSLYWIHQTQDIDSAGERQKRGLCYYWRCYWYYYYGRYRYYCYYYYYYC